MSSDEINFDLEFSKMGNEKALLEVQRKCTLLFHLYKFLGHHHGTWHDLPEAYKRIISVVIRRSYTEKVHNEVVISLGLFKTDRKEYGIVFFRQGKAPSEDGWLMPLIKKVGRDEYSLSLMDPVLNSGTCSTLHYPVDGIPISVNLINYAHTLEVMATTGGGGRILH